MSSTLEDARALDASDPLAPHRARFHLPENQLYLCGHSLSFFLEPWSIWRASSPLVQCLKALTSSLSPTKRSSRSVVNAPVFFPNNS